MARNKESIFKMNGGHPSGERAEFDYYATPPIATEALMRTIDAPKGKVWECACGGGAISDVLKAHGCEVLSTDLVDRGYQGQFGRINFLDFNGEKFDGDIVTNPPYSLAEQFVKKAIASCTGKVIMLLRLQFLEGVGRYRRLFSAFPPVRVHLFAQRVSCIRDGDKPMNGGGAVAYAWFVWEQGFRGHPEIRWIPPFEKKEEYEAGLW